MPTLIRIGSGIAGVTPGDLLRTDQLPEPERAQKELRLDLYASLEAAAVGAGARLLSIADRKDDSKSNRRAVARAKFFSRRRNDKINRSALG